MLHVLQVSYTTECIPPVQNTLESLTPQIRMTSGGDKLCRDHRITECVRLEETTVGHLAQSPDSHRALYTMLIRSMSSWLLNIHNLSGQPIPVLRSSFPCSGETSHVLISAHCFSSCCSSPRRALVLTLYVLPFIYFRH